MNSVKLFIINKDGEEDGYFLNEKKAYQKVISEIESELQRYSKLFEDQLNKQGTKSKECMLQFYTKESLKEKYNYYLDNLETIYYYYYDGSCEQWEMFDYVNIFLDVRFISGE